MWLDDLFNEDVVRWNVVVGEGARRMLHAGVLWVLPGLPLDTHALDFALIGVIGCASSGVLVVLPV